MRRDINELKGLIRDLLNTHNADSEVIKELPKPLPGLTAATTTSSSATQGMDPDLADQQHQHRPQPPAALQSVSEENLSIEVKEKELISKALARHNHNRRKAAESLGISERTLYRKITQYGLE